jgi:ketosteroid isomerase-like protein
MDTLAVLDHHLAAFRAGDVDAVMEDYLEESVMVTPEGEIRGLAALRDTFSTFFADEFRPGSYEFTLDRIKIEGDIAYIVWHAASPTAIYPVGSDTFVIRDGKILVQTIVVHTEPP